jgi:magnesium-transporting ATPase (P-type)
VEQLQTVSMSVVVEDRNGKRQIITKGAVEEMLTVCSFAEFGGKVEPLTDGMRNKAQKFVKEMNAQGMRVLALAQKSFLSKENNFAIEDEKEMVLIGYLAFLDPPKESASLAIKQLHEHGVEVKVLSGDNEAVVKAISRQVGINTSDSVTGPELENMSKEAKLEAVMKCSIFSKLTPMQKAEIIQLLQKSNNTVGFLGDGINDAAALRESDIGISVDSAVDIAKESAASLIPSPRNPTVLLLFCRSWMISAFCIGVSFEKMLHFITASSLASLLIFSSSGPVTESEVLIPTCLEIAFTTASLSPESTFTSTPCSCSCLMASEADSFGGSRKAR